MSVVHRVAKYLGVACVIATSSFCVWAFCTEFPWHLMGGVVFGRAITYQIGRLAEEYGDILIICLLSFAYPKYIYQIIMARCGHFPFVRAASIMILVVSAVASACIILLLLFVVVMGSVSFH